MRDLASEIVAYLREHGKATALQIATGIEARGSDVATICRDDERVAGPTPGERGRLYYWTVPADPRPSQTPLGGHNKRVLEWLSDGAPHHHLSGYQLGVVLHSRIADLRKAGYVIRQWQEQHVNGRRYWYQLLSGPLTKEEGSDVPAGSSSVNGTAVQAAGARPASSPAPGLSSERGHAHTSRPGRASRATSSQLTIGEAA